ncbi:MAG: universal stress protein [Streptosporangiaceae bacterium]
MGYPAHRPGAGNGIPAGHQIVVGVNGSVASVAALAWAAEEARLRRAELVAVHAWETRDQCRAPYAARQGLPSRAEARAAAASLLSASVRAAFGQDSPPGLRAVVAEGRPEQVLPGRGAGIEMLVLGCTRRAGDFPAAPGPVHRACLHSALCPVVIVGCLTPQAPAPDRQGPSQPAWGSRTAPGHSAAMGCDLTSLERCGGQRAVDQPRVPSVTART